MKKNISIIILIICLAVSGFLTQGSFFSTRNLTNLTRQVSINGILSIAMTLVILTGGIDLSIGSVAALAGVVAALLQVNFKLGQLGIYGALLTIASALAVGFLCGLINGFLIVRSKVVPFIITLGTMVIARGLSLILSDGAAIAPLSESFNFIGQDYFSLPITYGILTVLMFLLMIRQLIHKNWINIFLIFLAFASAGIVFGSYRGLPVPVFIFIILASVAHYFLNYTAHGRYIIATGSNIEAAYLSGVAVDRLTWLVYIIMGSASGLAGAILTARLNGAMPSAGELFELDAIAAVVIGGTRLSGGVGTIIGSIIGAFMIGSINNVMSLMNITEFYQKVIKGIIIILAVWLDVKSRNKK